jgi:hypothetical protein
MLNPLPVHSQSQQISLWSQCQNKSVCGPSVRTNQSVVPVLGLYQTPPAYYSIRRLKLCNCFKYLELRQQTGKRMHQNSGYLQKFKTFHLLKGRASDWLMRLNVIVYFVLPDLSCNVTL